MISVIIPTYNRAAYLKEAIESVLNQTIQDFEIIVIDDNSTDNTKEVILSFKDKVRYIFQNNEERAAARNKGIMSARGDYIALLDSDDLWLPDHLQSCLEAINGSARYGLAFSGSYIIDEEGQVISKMPFRRFDGNVLREVVAEYSSGGCNASSCLIKKEIFKIAGYFNEDKALSGSEDWEMWARISAYTEFVTTKRYSAKVRFHKNKSSINAERMAKSMKMALDLIFSNPDISPKIADLRDSAYSSLYAVTAINYYATGDMDTARKYLSDAVATYPLSLFKNRVIAFTYLRSLLGASLSSALRRTKWHISSKLVK